MLLVPEAMRKLLPLPLLNSLFMKRDALLNCLLSPSTQRVPIASVPLMLVLELSLVCFV